MLWHPVGGTSITANACVAGEVATGIDATGTLTCEQQAAPVVFLSDYATCDGSDETTEIQDAIDDACGGTLYVPVTPVTACSHASTLTGCSALTIVGSEGIDRSAVAPHRITYTGTGTGWDFSGLQSIVLRGFEVRAGSASFSAGTLLEFDGASYITLDRMYVIASSGQADAATSKAINANDTVDLDIQHTLFTRFGYHLYGRATSGDFANNIRISDSVFYRAEACSIQNLGDAITITDSWWQQQGASDTKSNVLCHGAGICTNGFTMTGSMSVDQPNGPTVPVFDICGGGVSITGNFIGGNTTQDGIRISEPCDGCTIQGNWFGFLDDAITFTGTGSDSDAITIDNNDYDTVTTTIENTQPARSTMRTMTSNLFFNEPFDIYVNVDSNADSGAGAFVIGSNATGNSATQQYVFLEGGYAQFRRGNDIRLHETDDGNYVQLSAPTLSADWTLTWPDGDGATNDLLCNSDGSATMAWCAITAYESALEAVLDHNDLQGLTTGDPHTQYALLAGRSGGQTLIGGTASGDDLTLQSTSNATRGTVAVKDVMDVGDDVPDQTTGTATLIDMTPTVDITGAGGTINGALFAPQTTMSGTGEGLNALRFTPNVTASSTGPLIRGLLMDGTIAYSNTSDPFPVYQVNGVGFGPTFTSSTANGALYQDAFIDFSTIQYTGAGNMTDTSSATGNAWAPISFLSKFGLTTTNTGDYSIGAAYGLHFLPGIATDNASSSLNVEYLSAVSAASPLGGAAATSTVTHYSVAHGHFDSALPTNVALTNAYGLYLTDWDKATNNYTVHSSGAARMLHGGRVDIGDSVGNATSGTTTIVDISPSSNVTGSNTVLKGNLFAPTTTQSPNGVAASNYLRAYAFEPTLTFTSSGALSSQFVYGLHVSGTTTTTDTNSLPNLSVVRNDTTFSTSTAGASPVANVYVLDNAPTITSTASSGANTTSVVAMANHTPIITSGGAGTLGVTNDIGLNVGGVYNETAGTLNVTTRTGFKFNEATITGTPQITTNVGVDIAALGAAGATTNIGIRNADTTVWTPPTTVTVGAAFTLTATATTQKLDASAARTSDTTTAINDGVADGQMFTIINVDTTPDIITIKDAANTDFGGADCALNSGGTLTVIWISVLSNWLKISCSAN